MLSGDEARRDKVMREAMSESIGDLAESLERETLSALAWMIADGILEFRLAVPRGELSGGEFHDKFGIFSDSEGNRVSFNGSYNDSIQGLRNYESIKIFTSWNEAFAPLVEWDAARFEALWNNRDPNVRVYELPEAAKESILKLRTLDRPYGGSTGDRVKEDGEEHPYIPPGTIPSWLKLRDYQLAAIQAWKEKGGVPGDPNARRGILSMATGSGKTLTALYLACKLAERNSPFVLIVACPFVNLAEQWLREMRKFGLEAIGCFGGRRRWHGPLSDAFQRLNRKGEGILPIVVSNDTFSSEPFQNLLRPESCVHLFVADEVHNLGAENLAKSLPEGIKLRIGLSATPKRHHDDGGTNALLDYFGDIVYEFTLREAIEHDCLTRYHYHPVLVTLDEDEADEYADLTRRLSQFIRNDEQIGFSDGAKPLLMRRARLLGQARQKLTALDQILGSLPEKPTKAVFYCGDGRVSDPVTDEERRQLDAVSAQLTGQHDLRVRTFTFRESPAEREEILDQLREGSLDGIVAIRCLDEGIDVPELGIGFLLASSTNPRQFIQRRGRLLRKSEGKEFSVIYDFVVTPPDLSGDVDDKAFNMERNLFRRELVRITDFCETAENGPEALQSLQNLRKKYNLLAS
jgi:DNA phosphorothioation system restriction enzyme